MSVRLWQLAVIGGAFGSLAAGSCAKFLRYGPYPAGDAYALGFLVAAVLAGGPLVLLAFRLPRARRESWPGLAPIGWLVLAGTVAAAGGAAAVIAMATQLPLRWRIVPLFYALVVVAAAGLVVAVGAVNVLAIGTWWRRTDAR